MSAVLNPIDQIERRRIDLGLTVSQLTVASGVGKTTYYRWLADSTVQPQKAAVSRLKAALSRLTGSAKDLADPKSKLVAYSFLAILSLVCERRGVPTWKVHAHDPARRATSDPAWMLASQIRRQAMYLVNVGLGIEQSEVARAVGLTPAAVSLACQKVESEREDGGDLDRLLDELTRTITGDHQ